MKYYLANTCNNTFILFDFLKESTLDKKFLREARLLLESEQKDDVLILMRGASKASSYYAHMAVWGLDGTFGEFCANGALACAAYLFDKYPTYEHFYLQTTLGKNLLTHCGCGVYSVHIPPPKFIYNPRFIVKSPLIEKYHYVEAIEPHLVIPQELSNEELLALGKKLNGQKHIFPRGMNINSCSIVHDNTLKIKTYERGVQRLTQACGTGSIACASWYLQQTMGTVRVMNSGGTLEVEVNENGVILKGEACYV